MTDKGPEKFYNKYETSYYGLAYLKFSTIVDFAKVFREKYGNEEVYKLVGKVADEDARKMVKQAKTQMPVNNFEDFKKLYIGIMSSDMMKVALTYEIVESTDKKFRFNCTECLYAKGFADLNESELGYHAVCHADYAMVEAAHPKVKLSRTKTLMKGDDLCDFCFTWED